jgi:hypothetical protein
LAGLLRLPHDGIALNEHYKDDGAFIYKRACPLRCEGSFQSGLARLIAPAASTRLKIKNPAATAVKRGTEEDWS